MASTYRSAVLGCLGVVLGMAGAGCQTQPAVTAIPKPDFNGPVLAPQPRPVAPAPVAAAPTRRAPAIATGPRDWAAKAPARAWKWIVIHHSATPAGGARTFDKMHKEKGWDELGYHFVIGNGTDTADGQVEVGPRWPRQKWGAHAKTPDNRFNDYGIGICLVGNFDVERPTAKQMQSLSRLVAYLMQTYRVSPDRIVGHGDTKATDCPGRFMSIAQVRQLAARQVADSGGEVPDDAPGATAASAELLGSATAP